MTIQAGVMGHTLPPRELELYKRCDEVLHYIWDPIGVSNAPGARDEYHPYLPQVFSLVRDGADSERIEAYLLEIERDRMGLSGNPEGAGVAAGVLLSWREWLREHAT